MEEWLVEEIALEVEVDLSLLASVITRWLGRKTGVFQDANCIAHQNFAAVAHTSSPSIRRVLRSLMAIPTLA